MKETNIITLRGCPRCGRPYADHPALSRQDNEPPICQDCGTREALDSIGVGIEEQNKILEIIHRSRCTG